jgi:hypothetical protein
MKDFVIQPEVARVGAASQASTVPQSRPAKAPVTAGPSHDAIARRAFDIYTKSGSQKGHCKRNWQQAEQELHNASVAMGAAQECGCAEAPAARAGSQPVVKSYAGAVPSIVGGRGSGGGGTTPVPSGGHLTLTPTRRSDPGRVCNGPDRMNASIPRMEAASCWY